MLIKLDNIIEPIQESLHYTWENFKDMMSSMVEPDIIRGYYKKFSKVEREYKKYYRFDKQITTGLRKAIEDYNNDISNKNEVINVYELDKILHLRLRMEIEGDHRLFRNTNRYKLYAYLYRMMIAICDPLSTPGYMTQYTFPTVVEDKYVVFITFDENGIDAVQGLARPNTYDITGNIELIDVPLHPYLTLDDFRKR